MKLILLAFTTAIILLSCSKDDEKTPDDGIKPEDKVRAQQLQAFLEANEFKLSKYYSDTPIDYIDTDQVVKAEKDLWEYVSLWLKDDKYSFEGSSQALVHQNADKIETDNSETITRQYSVTADTKGVLFKFLNHQYQALDYRLVSQSDTAILVSASWNGKTVNSEYKVAP